MRKSKHGGECYQPDIISIAHFLIFLALSINFEVTISPLYHFYLFLATLNFAIMKRPEAVNRIFTKSDDEVLQQSNLLLGSFEANKSAFAERFPESVKIYEKVMAMGVSKKTEAYLHKKIAESYFKGSVEKKARVHLRRAFELEPKLKGAQKICEKLSVGR